MPLNSLYEKLLFSLRSFSREKRADRKRKKHKLCFGACGEWAGERKLLSFINQPGAEEMLGIGRRKRTIWICETRSGGGAVSSSSSSSSSFPEMRKRQRGKERRGGGRRNCKRMGSDRWMDGWMDIVGSRHHTVPRSVSPSILSDVPFVLLLAIATHR